MKLKTLEINNFRNYAKQEINLSDGVNFFIGKNGSGKTNLLESIYFLALAKSYKTNETNLIKYDKDFAKIIGHVNNNERTNLLKIIISEKGKKATINNEEIRKLSNYIGVLNVMAFLPEDLMIIKGSPKDRRYFIDLVYGQIDKNYLNELSNYKILLKQRNELLKKLSETDKPDIVLLDVITEQISSSAEVIINFRRSFIKKINSFLNSMYKFLSDKDKNFRVEYLPSIEENVEQLLKGKYKTDLMLKTTNFGPHRDDYSFYLDEFIARDNASQGEQRIMILTLILAIGEIIYNFKKERPIFLLDDVFSELDFDRQNKLIKYLIKLQAQTIITTTSLENIENDIIKNSKIFKVQNNTIQEVH